MLIAALCGILIWSFAVGASPAVSASPNGTSADSSIRTVEPSWEMHVSAGRSVRLRSPLDIRRTAIDDATVSDVVQVAPTELLVLGKHAGSAHVTVWSGGTDVAPMVFLVRVTTGE